VLAGALLWQPYLGIHLPGTGLERAAAPTVPSPTRTMTEKVRIKASLQGQYKYPEDPLARQVEQCSSSG
jgi:hypothetical protein